MRPAQKGITLLEVLVAVVIMVVMTALALPSISKFSEGLSLRSAATRMSTMMRLAQRYAINYNAVYRIDISPSQNWAALYSNDSAGELIGTVYRPPNLIAIATTTINGTSSSELVSKGSIKFYGKGTASPSSYIHIVRTNSFFSNTKDSYGAQVTDAIPYYQPGYDYSPVSDTQKEQCYTLRVEANTGRVKLYKYGIGGPWD